MKRSWQVGLSLAARRLFFGFAAAVAAVLAFESASLGATPVDIYQDMESGSAGNVLTAAIMNASSHGAWWSASSGTMWVATKYSRDLPGPVTVGGVTYNGTGGTRTWKYNNNNSQNFVSANVSSSGYTNVTIACYYTTEYTVGYNWDLDTIVLFGANYCVLQVFDTWTPTGPFIRAHCGYNGAANVGPGIKITAGKTYWVNLNWNGGPTNTGASVAVFDPDNGFSQVGTSFTNASPGGPLGNWNIMFGRQDNHGNNTNDASQSYMDHICIDYTNHVFPLIPSAGTDTTPPSAPGTVRDGTGADIAYTGSTTQLAANWDASSDAQSGISGYQYAIGTSAGGTQTLNWTSLGNVTTVTKTGLSLTNGQTYYFSVKAVNGVGLTGSATNSNGQTVDSTAPSAPPNVRDGTGTDIATTSSNTQLSANWDASTDNESGISGYQYAIGTSAGGTQTVNWTSLGNVTTVTKTGLTLTNGQTYFFSVRAVDGAGLTGSATNSNGQTVQTTDATAPSAPPNVRDGTGTDISTTSSTTQLSANWDASTDNESGISGYQYAIGTSAGGTQTVNWTSLGNVTTVTKTGLTLSVGQTYYFSVKAVNGAGLTGSATNSNGQTVVSVSNAVYFSDNFENWTVHGGAWSSVSGENSTQALNTSTDYAMAGAKSLKLTDNDSTSIGACLVKNFSPVISGNIYVRFFVYLPTGFTSANTGCAYRRLLRVWCGSNRGQFSLAVATPLMEEVGAWGASQASSALSENAWHCVEMYMAGPSASTPMQYWIDGVSTGTLNGSFASSSTYDKIEFGNASLGGGANVNGTYYLDELIVANTYIDSSVPSAPATVRDGTGADISTTGSTTQLSANWDAATDADSGISGYQYAIGTSAGGTQTVNWTSLGNVTTMTASGLSLSVGQTYYVSVRSVNGAGLNSTGTSSNGQTVVASTTTYFSDNFENWAVHGGAWSSVNGESSNHTLNTSTDYARAGSKSVKITDTDSTGTTGAFLTKNFSPVISGDIYVRFYVFLPTGYASADATCARRVLRVWCGSNRGQLTLTGNNFSMQEVGGWTGTGPTAISENAWHCIEIHVTAPSASTPLQYWVDGTSAGTCTGTFSGSSTFDHVELGDVLLATGTVNSDGTIYWDEVIVSNAYNGL